MHRVEANLKLDFLDADTFLDQHDRFLIAKTRNSSREMKICIEILTRSSDR